MTFLKKERQKMNKSCIILPKRSVKMYEKIVVFLSLFLLVACQNTNISNENEGNKKSNQSFTASSEDVIAKNDKIENFNGFTLFLNNIDNKTKDRIRIIQYTTEGDPIIQKLEYDGKLIHITEDQSKINMEVEK